MTQDIDLHTAFMGYTANLNKSGFSDENAISAGRAAALALEMNSTQMARLTWKNYVPNVAGMPSLEEFYAAYKQHRHLFNAFVTGEEKDGAAFTAPGTPFSNAAGSYARGLYYAAHAAQPAGKDSLEYWAGRWGGGALMSAGFFKQGAQLSEAIDKGLALEMVKGKELGA